MIPHAAASLVSCWFSSVLTSLIIIDPCALVLTFLTELVVRKRYQRVTGNKETFVKLKSVK